MKRTRPNKMTWVTDGLEQRARHILAKVGLDPDDPEVDAALSEPCGFEEFERRLEDLIKRKGKPCPPRAPEDSKFVFLLERHHGRWFPIMELHAQCAPGHKQCKRLDRSDPCAIMGHPGFATAADAKLWLMTWLDENNMSGVFEPTEMT